MRMTLCVNTMGALSAWGCCAVSADFVGFKHSMVLLVTLCTLICCNGLVGSKSCGAADQAVAAALPNSYELCWQAGAETPGAIPVQWSAGHAFVFQTV